MRPSSNVNAQYIYRKQHEKMKISRSSPKHRNNIPMIFTIGFQISGCKDVKTSRSVLRRVTIYRKSELIFSVDFSFLEEKKTRNKSIDIEVKLFEQKKWNSSVQKVCFLDRLKKIFEKLYFR